MANFLRSLFFGDSEESGEAKAARNFDVLKYDGIKALKIGKSAYAVRCFEEALKLKEDPEILENLVTAYTREDRLDEAIRTADRLVAAVPDNVPVLLLHANLNMMAENYADALADCEKAAALDKENPLVFHVMGRARKGSGDAVGAIVALSQAIALKADFADALLMRAELMLEAGDYRDGLQDAESVVGLLPEEENAYLLRGRLQDALGNTGAAEEDYSRVKELNPFNEQAYLRLGELYIRKEEPDEAISLLDEAIELRPDFARAYNERGRARLMKGDKEGSFADMKKSLELEKEGAAEISGTYSNFEDMYKNRPL